MDVTISHTILAYLLALYDLSDLLSDREKENLKRVAKDLDLNAQAWQDHLEPDLIQIIQGNSQLDRSYQFYKEKLAQAGEIPLDLLPKATEIEWLRTDSSSLVVRGMIPNSSASGYEQQLNNVVIVVNLADKPEETVKKLTFLNQVKQFLDQDSQ